MAVELPQWLQDMRRVEVVGRVGDDPRSRQGTFFGLTKDEAMNCVGRGQAQFDEPWGEMSPADRALLYAYFNQKGHLEELTEAFRLIFANQMPNNPIVIDLGCGPATGGLALAGVLDPPNFDYIGVDQSVAMRGLGEQLAASAPRLSAMRRCWASDLESVSWNRAPGWRPVLVIVSYLLASRTLKPATLVDQLDALLARLGNGRATMLYTNSRVLAPIATSPLSKRRCAVLASTCRPTGLARSPLTGGRENNAVNSVTPCFIALRKERFGLGTANATAHLGRA